VPASGTCPSAAEAADLLVGDHCGYVVNAVTGEATITPVATWDTGAGSGTIDMCCYPTLEAEPVGSSCVVGRPFIDASGERVAPARRGRSWARGRRPRLARLSAVERAVLAAAWTQDALVEHASVAAFARTTLELMALGAPAELVAGAQAAAADEVRHARVSFALASAYAAPARAGGCWQTRPPRRKSWRLLRSEPMTRCRGAMAASTGARMVAGWSGSPRC
jgi:hypothetical protein